MWDRVLQEQGGFGELSGGELFDQRGRALQVEGAVQAEAVRWEHAGPHGEQVAWAGPGRGTVGHDAERKVWGLNCQAGGLAKENLAVREGK